MSEQLRNCKLTINSVAGIATLYSSIRHTRITEEIKKTISTKQTEIEGAVTIADKQLIVLEKARYKAQVSYARGRGASRLAKGSDEVIGAKGRTSADERSRASEDPRSAVEGPSGADVLA
ncbi:MAG: hypothetical protein Q9190_006964 [Brigantiaea leucoxantha]